MKKGTPGPWLLWIMFVLLPFNLLAQVKEVPITTSSKEALKYFLEGRDKNEDSELVAAAALFDKAIAKDTAFALAYTYRAYSGGGYDVYRKNMDKSVSLADKVSKGEKMEILFFQALAEGNNEKQKETIDQLLKSFPADKRVQILAGYYYANLGDLSKALSHYKKSAELDSKHALAFNMIGYTESALNNYAAAEKAFQTYIKLKPDKANPYDSYGELLLKMGKYDESVAQYKKALEINPSFTNSLAGLGNAYIFKGDYTLARKYYQDLYDKAPGIDGKFYSLYLKALSYLHEGKTDDAIRTLNERYAMAEKEGQILTAIYTVADQRFIITETGNPAEGMKYCEKAKDLIEKAKLSDSDKAFLIKYSDGWYIYNLIELGEIDKALTEQDKYLQKYGGIKDPANEKGNNFYMGSIEHKKGNYDKAIEYYTKSDTIMAPHNWYSTAVAYAQKGDKKNAAKYYGKIVRLNVNSLDLALFRNQALAELKK